MEANTMNHPSQPRRVPTTSGELKIAPVGEMKLDSAQAQLRTARVERVTATQRTTPMKAVADGAVATRQDWYPHAGDQMVAHKVKESVASTPNPAPVERNEWDEVNADDTPMFMSAPSAPSAEVPTVTVTTAVMDESEADDWELVNQDDTPLGGTPVVTEPVFADAEAVGTELDDWELVNEDETPMPSLATSPVQVEPEKVVKAKKSSAPKPPKRSYEPELVKADLKVFKALSRMRFGSVEHVRSFLINAQATGITTTYKSIYNRLNRLSKAKVPYVISRHGVDVSRVHGGEAIWTVTAHGMQVSSECFGYVPPLDLHTDRFQNSMAHLAIQASYISTLNNSTHIAIPDVAIQPRINFEVQNGDGYFPYWEPEMDVYGEAQHLGVRVPGSQFPHTPDLMVLKRRMGQSGHVEHTIDHAVEVETSAKTVDEYVNLLSGYKDADIPVKYFVSNTLLPGAPDSSQRINYIYNRIKKAATLVWLVPDDQVDNIPGFSVEVAPLEWKSTDPAGRRARERAERA